MADSSGDPTTSTGSAAPTGNAAPTGSAPPTGSTAFAGSTARGRRLAPAREFLRTEAGSAAILVAAAIAALAWINIAPDSYRAVWSTELSISVGDAHLGQDLREWVNNGLMAFFFFVVGLEARREFDMGELRERRRFTLPVLAAFGYMLLPVLIYLALNLPGPAAHGWGVAMSTDTAFALGVLALAARRAPARLRLFLLTVFVVDDMIALVVIGTAYTERVSPVPLAIAVGLFAVVLGMRGLGVRRGLAYLPVGVAMWVAMLRSGVEPVIVGLALGLATTAFPAARGDLEHATRLFRSFREQPTPQLARSARMSVDYAISPNERLANLLHPWTSYVVVPLFALANAGIEISATFLARAVTSPITLGIFLGYVVGKPLGLVVAAWLVRRFTSQRLPVGWGALLGGGAAAGVGFTVSLLIASLAFTGDRLAEAKIGVLATAVVSALVSVVSFRLIRLLPPERKARALLGPAEAVVDLVVPVDSGRDHTRGPQDAPVTLVEYGDYECPYCGQAEQVVRELLREFGDDVRYVWRHLPLTDVHPHAQLAAEAAEAAGAQDAYWPMHDLLFAHQDALNPKDLVRYAQRLDLDTGRFVEDLRRHGHAGRVAEDVDGADLSSVSGTPTFFINGIRYHGAYDIHTLSAAVRAARLRAMAAVPAPPRRRNRLGASADR